MSTVSEDGLETGAARQDDAVEALLLRAAPRPVPPGKDEKMVRDAVFTEWQAMTGKRRQRTRFMQFGIAATILLALAVSFNSLRVQGVAPQQVATISKSNGSIYVLGEQATVQRLPETSVVMAGQTIKTDRDSGLGLEWGNGGSLRIAANTVVEFISAEEVYLHSGRIYFDSQPAELIASISGGSGAAKFQVDTDHGRVRHLGTQYMTYSASDVLEVSVREGEVSIEGRYHDEKALAGQRLSLSGSARATVLNIDTHGAAWNWVEETSPIVDTDGRSVEQFLNWVSRETGLRVEYPNEATQRAAASTILKGSVNLKPSEALEFWSQGQDLSWITDGGAIKVSAIDGSSGL